MQTIPVFITSDNNYAPYVATLMASILTGTDSFINFYIMDSGISLENQEKIKTLKNDFANFSIEFIEIDPDKYYQNLKCKDISNRIPIVAYNCALIPVVKPDLDKVLYLDPDIIVFDDIKKLYDFDMQNYIIGALWEEFGEKNINIRRKKKLNLNVDHKYFNAGVLIINVQKWLKEKITEKIFNAWRKNEENLEAAIQDVMNIVFDNSNYMLFDSRFNWLNQNYEFYKETPDILVRHFNGPVKPWHITPDLNEDKRLGFAIGVKKFWHYAKMTPFYDELIKKIRYKNKMQLTKYMVYNLMRENKNTKIVVN